MFSSRLFVLTGSIASLGGLAACSATLEKETPPATTSGGGSGGATSSSATSSGMTSVGATSTSVASSSGTAGASGGTGGAGGNGGSNGNSGGSGGGVATIDASDGARAGGTDASTGDSGVVRPSSDAAVPSTGCGNAAGQALATYVTKDTMSGGVARSYRLYLPGGYNLMRAYPLVILAHGCTGNGGTPFPLETASKTDAIVVALKSVGDCFVYGATGADVTYFDTVLAEVSASFCVDRSRVFMAGHSSGSYLTYTVGCVRAGILRAQGNAAGAQVNLPACAGPIAALIAHDMGDPENAFAGGERARDRILKDNGCGTDTVPYDYDGNPSTASPCLMYQGCKAGYPVVWCPTTGQGHSNQVPITTVGLWRFWSQL